MERIPLGPGFDDGKVFRSVFAAYPDALLVVDQQGLIVLANPAAIDLLGYTGDELIGLDVEQLVPDAVRPRHATYRHGYAKAPRARPMGRQLDLTAKRRDGSQVMVEIALSPLHNDGLPYVVAAIRGIDGYPRVQAALKRARYAEQLAHFGRLMVDAADSHALLLQVPTIVTDALDVDTAVILMQEPNGLSLRIAAGTGLPTGTAVGDLVATDASPLAGAISAPISDRGRTIGTLAVGAHATERFGEDEERFLGSLSSMLATLLQREKSEEALRHSQRLESVGQLTGGIAHDFNNLLTVISGNLQVLEDVPGCADDPAIRPLIASAMRATRRGAELTGKLLAFSRRQVLQPAVIDARALLESLTDMLRRTLDQRIAIHVQAEDALCMADPVQLESALLNIAINARDAMPQGGTLSFDCRVVGALPPPLTLDEPEKAGQAYVAFSVADTGEGMSEVVKARAFEPFFTTKDAGRGTGLGLATVYGFARQSHGALGLQSAIGIGTTLTLYLPLVREDGAEGALEDVHTATSAGTLAPHAGLPPGLRVLVVEDDAEVRGIVQKFLVSMGCEARFCATAEEALPVLASDTPLGLLLTDIALGAGLRGTELADAAKKLRPGLPVLLMSGFSSDLLGAPGAWELLRKPYTRAELESAIRKVLRAAQ
ncbi:MAG: PAS domain S-box protein [Pseudomonadota bacterium]